MRSPSSSACSADAVAREATAVSESRLLLSSNYIVIDIFAESDDVPWSGHQGESNTIWPWSTGTARSVQWTLIMATEKQREAARKNIKKAQAAAREKRTISKLPKSTRTALGKQGAKAARQKRGKD
jgi:hypothetical protein